MGPVILFSAYLLVWFVILHWDGHGYGFTIILVPLKSALSYSMVDLLVPLCHFIHGYFQGPNPPQMEHFFCLLNE